MDTVDFLTEMFLGWESHTYCTETSVRKIVNDGLSKTLVRALPYSGADPGFSERGLG